ncbi:hypothetical protein GUK34_13470, partial [Rhizobium leguminosarum]|nr:hypothetical protein [Rhizobium ruizarguesonis]
MLPPVPEGAKRRRHKGALTSCWRNSSAGRRPADQGQAMAIYHFSMKPIARSGGRSAVASAAYRAAVRLTNERDGLTHD